MLGRCLDLLIPRNPLKPLNPLNTLIVAWTEHIPIALNDKLLPQFPCP
jgi:hypothetical protein